MPALIFSVLICGGVGAALGCFYRHSPDWRVLLANARRGALYGALVGTAFYFVQGAGSSTAMNQSTQNVKHITQTEFDAVVIHSPKPVVVDFYATWCGPCKILSPQLDKLAASFTNEIKFVKVNVDESPALSQHFNIQAIPTLLFFKEGRVVNHLVGLPVPDELKARLDSFAEANSQPN